ncbi:ribonucleoside-diphosphate reductase, adenosylcobalamin-dependent [Tepiditoga spiralis]|uniref:Vitamin B12-dependent ribonucleotide reductase n=1 Tax=Tepiditoga spiralis TaxID=2108365 RepID=A0A7G1GBJ6_9BACT|nr:adenosylcobalamin-dependent ribonucleoside-diphosphate reductase [Tepiditoga spiralis]BBE31129.1 ribonucleoside-diphosphate reductase, adenosylcobalamin-dependent [Tepiditoga spiralis]
MVSKELNDLLIRLENVKPSQNAYTILKDRYFLKDENREYLENDWDDIAKRVARHVASAEVLYTDDVEKIREIENIYYRLVLSRVFLPNSPTLFNSGKTMSRKIFTKEVKDMIYEDYKYIYDNKGKHNMLSACFVIPMEDSMEGIFNAVKNSAMIMKYGGGVGYDFSVLRPQGSSIAGTGGKSSGPISFMNVFNVSASTIEQGGARRAAQMAVMRYDHPNVLNFIHAKKNNDGKSVLNYFNISVNIDNPEEFLELVNEDGELSLIHGGKEFDKIKAKEMLKTISENAWKSGDPGLLFLGRHNKYYAMSEKTPVRATNPCGEEPLPPYGSCNLGSIDIAKLINDFDITRENEVFKEIVYWCTRFLDDVIDINVYPLKEIEEMSRAQRFIGLGIMGLADALYYKELPYDSNEGREFMAKVTAALAYYSHVSSSDLAKERGNFPEFENSKYPKAFIPFPMLKEDYMKQWNEKIIEHFNSEAIKYKRNVQTNTIAPTGSISNLADTSSGIEPNFMLAYIRYMTDKEGNKVPLPYINKVLLNKLNSHMTDDLEAEIIEKGSLKNINGISEELKRIFITSMDISPLDHVLAQNAIQSYLDASCSKTINMPNDVSVDDVYDIYKKALSLNLKGITIYRDGSLQTQVLTSNEKKEKVSFFVIDEKHKLRARPRKDTLRSVTRKFKADGNTVYITLAFDDTGEAIEIFLSDGTETAEVIGRLSSIALRAGVSSDEIMQQLTKVKGEYCVNLSSEIKKAIDDFENLWEKEDVDYKVLKTGVPMSKDDVEKFVHANDLKYEKGLYVDNDGNTYCPSCLTKNSLIMVEGCTSCKKCGWSKCS